MRHPHGGISPVFVDNNYYLIIYIKSTSFTFFVQIFLKKISASAPLFILLHENKQLTLQASLDIIQDSTRLTVNIR